MRTFVWRREGRFPILILRLQGRVIGVRHLQQVRVCFHESPYFLMIKNIEDLVVDETDLFHLDRWPAKRPWPVAACIKVVSSFVFIHLIIFLCCVEATAKKALVVPHCGNLFQHCCHLPTFSNYFHFFLNFSFCPREREGRVRKLDCDSFLVCLE